MSNPLPRRPDLSIVICTLNEHEAIGGVIDELRASLAEVDHEILVVDDSSDERTAEAVLRHAAGSPRVRLLRRRHGRGRGLGCRPWPQPGTDGRRRPARSAIDGRAAALRLREDGADVAVASRYMGGRGSGLGLIRHAMSRGATRATQLLLGVRVADPMSGCFMMTREWYEKVRPELSGLGFKILVDVPAAARCCCGPCTTWSRQLPG